MRMKCKALAVAALLAISGFASPLSAQAVPPSPQAQWSDITEVVVRARVRGPVMWKLTRDDATIWVLGILDVKPNDLRWNSNHFRRELQGAKALILPRESHWDPVNSDLPKHVHLQDVIAPATWRRFEDTATRDSFNVATYDNYKPVWAGARLMSDVIDDHDISNDVVPEAILDIARSSGVTMQFLQRDDAQTMLGLYDTLDARDSETCLDDYLDSIDYLVGDMPKVARAWAHGDLRTVLSLHRELGYTTCIASDPATAAQYRAYAIDDVADAIDDALKTPGKSVAVWPLSDLLRKGGVLDRLRDEGVTITSPAG